jgi:hypothetical protein
VINGQELLVNVVGVNNDQSEVLQRASDSLQNSPQTYKGGLQIRVYEDFSEIGARISSKSAGMTKAHVYDVKEGDIISSQLPHPTRSRWSLDRGWGILPHNLVNYIGFKILSLINAFRKSQFCDF